MTAEHENETRVRLRRTKSVTHAEEIQKAEQRVRKSQPDKPYGIRVDPRQWFLFLSGKYDGGEEHPSILLIVYSTVPVTLCLLIEKGMSLDIISHGPGMVFHIVNLIVMVLMPMVVIHVKDSGFSLIGAMYVCTLYAILFLKLWSYIQVNMWCRISRGKTSGQGRMRRQSLSYNNLQSTNVKQNGVKSDDIGHEVNGCGMALVQYPDNLNFGDLYYYILAPTLCYELNFPRTQRIRKRFLIKRILEVVVGCQVVMSLFQQWMIPSVKNSLIPFSNMDVAKASERLLKLAIPNHLMWLCFFYLIFHSYLNLMGELLHFADRNFYCDWWNSNNIDTFWRSWNMPVHRWAVRHLYIPVVEMGYSKTTASVTVFFISAFFHEYLVSVPLKTFKIWAFMGMMGQMPLSALSKLVERHWGARWGNIVVWSSLIIGQPLCILMYYHDYVVTHFGETLLEDYSIV
ncbi:diacylglycerol O-acyltransferase 1 isoform X2 [Vespula pensylvanica]|uniref:diacylglycerol O-acyltransferase 1 isoform X2 n=1 Tax=Vespula pensylvanica TaxID=30213 RepID=UPI001CBA4015|nr:diacylglycerol O-acyltransferase 1 isoform X2 [Vespula pensylvanica]